MCWPVAQTLPQGPQCHPGSPALLHTQVGVPSGLPGLLEIIKERTRGTLRPSSRFRHNINTLIYKKKKKLKSCSEYARHYCIKFKLASANTYQVWDNITATR